MPGIIRKLACGSAWLSYRLNGHAKKHRGGLGETACLCWRHYLVQLAGLPLSEIQTQTHAMTKLFCLPYRQLSFGCVRHLLSAANLPRVSVDAS